jgi:hypothetical protein
MPDPIPEAGETLLGGSEPATTPPVQTTQTTQTTTTAEPNVPIWLPKELQTNELLKKHAKPSDLAKAYLDLHDRSQKAVVRPDEKATDEEKALWKKTLGVPTDIAGYEIPEAIEGVKLDKARLENLAKIAFESNISKEAFKKIVEADAKGTAQEYAALKSLTIKALAEATDKLKSEWGVDFEKNASIAKRFYSSAFEKELAGVFKASGLENNPAFIKAMVNLAKKTGATDGEFLEGNRESVPQRKYIMDYKD